MKRLGDFEQLVLFAVLRLGDDAYGVSVRLEIEARTGRNVSAGALYTTLGRLERRGFVASRGAEGAAERGGRPRKYYRLLPAGARALYETISQLRSMAEGQQAVLAALAGHRERP